MEQPKSGRRQIAEALMKCVERQFPVAAMAGAMFALRNAGWGVRYPFLLHSSQMGVVPVAIGYFWCTAMICASDIAIHVPIGRGRTTTKGLVYGFALAATLSTFACAAQIAKAAIALK